MNPNNRMIRLNRLSTHKPAISRRLLCLREPAMLSPQTLEQLLDRLRQTLVGDDLRHPGRVAARGRHGEQRQDGDAGRLVLVRHVRVPARRGQFGGFVLCAIEVVWAEVDVVEFEEAVDVSADGLVIVHQYRRLKYVQKTQNDRLVNTYVDMQPTKILAKLLLLLGANILKVLVPEDDNTPLSNQQRKLILLRIRELRELQATNLSADAGRQFRNDNIRIVWLEEVRLVLVGEVAAVVEVEGFEGREFGDGVVDGEVAFVFVLYRPVRHIYGYAHVKIGADSPPHASSRRTLPAAW